MPNNRDSPCARSLPAATRRRPSVSALRWLKGFRPPAFLLVVLGERPAVRLDAQEGEGEPDGERTGAEEQEGGQYGVGRRLWRQRIVGAGDDREAERPQDLADAVRRLRQPGGARTQAHPIDLDDVRREVRGAALEEENGRDERQGLRQDISDRAT